MRRRPGWFLVSEESQGAEPDRTCAGWPGGRMARGRAINGSSARSRERSRHDGVRASSRRALGSVSSAPRRTSTCCSGRTARTATASAPSPSPQLRPCSGRGAGSPALALACAAAVASHVLLDWLGSDTTPPLGVMALWPFTSDFYQSPFFLFMAISRRWWLPGFYTAERPGRAARAGHPHTDCGRDRTPSRALHWR